MNRLLLVALISWAVVGRAFAEEVIARDAAEFREAVRKAKPGTRIVLAPGSYGGGFFFGDVRGEAGRPIVLAAQNPQEPPVFQGGKVGIHFSKSSHLELHGLSFQGQTDNGLNIDDGKAGDPPVSHIVLRGLRFSDIGGTGNQDAIKLSGAVDFRVSNCTIDRWGGGGGSAIDMVGCHRGVIEGNTIRHGDAPNCTGVQCKGGTSDIRIEKNRFENAGGRAVNIGGSTGLQFFRPPLAGDGPHAEARAIRVEGNHFVGGVTPIAFVGVDGAVVRFNTIERPGRWALRILQETKDPRFVACRNGEFSDNVIVFESTRWGEGGVNIGGGTAPETFKFARNWWYCADRPDRSRPKLPAAEAEGVYGVDPTQAKGKAGADAWKPL